jgi:hypothetical protein
MHFFNGYLIAKFPPVKKAKVCQGIRVYKNLVRAHKKTYDIPYF